MTDQDVRDFLERMAAEEPVPFLDAAPLTRRARRRAARTVVVGALGVAVAVAVLFAGVAEIRTAPAPIPADTPPATFVGTWTSTELEFSGSSQTMTIRPAAGGLFDIALHDDSSLLCSTRRTRVDGVDTPSTMTANARLTNATTLVVTSPVLTCADGREPTLTWGYQEEGGTGYTLVLDRATDRLFDTLGVTWHRGEPAETGADGETDWTSSMPGGTYSMLGGEITFHAPKGRPWIDHAEAYIDARWFFLLGEPGSGLPDGSSIDIVVNPSPEEPCKAPASIPASAETMIQVIRSNPDLEATAPVVERVGGIEAQRLDVAAVPGASTCIDGTVPLLSVPGQPWGDIAHGERVRLYVLDLTKGHARSLVDHDHRAGSGVRAGCGRGSSRSRLVRVPRARARLTPWATEAQCR